MKDCTIKITWNKYNHEYIFHVNNFQAYKLVTYLKRLIGHPQQSEPRGTLAAFIED
tara:strand:+ start:523 stop:690 length:168 start_codon:yes stop_codon:yes gene_type:complete